MQDESNLLLKDALSNIVDREYGEQYAELFPDVIPPVEALDSLEVGDCLVDSESFISMVLSSYEHEANMVLGKLYKPPRISDIVESLRLEYIEEIEFMEEEGLVEDDTSVTFQLDEQAILGTDLAPRVVEVLDTLELTYLQEELVTHFNFKTNKLETVKVQDRIMNTSSINLFDFDFKNIWVDRGSKAYEQSIQEGYNNLLQTSVGII